MARSTGLAKEQQRTLARLKPVVARDHLYLAGGTAIAYHLGHRRSLDLDLFTAKKRISLQRMSTQLMTKFSDFKVIEATDVTLHVRIGSTAVDIVNYPYALLEPAAPGPGGFPTAGRLDLTVMKLSAIARRGIRRDFWDLKVLLESGISMQQAADAYRKRFGLAENDLYHVLTALTYFDDAERERNYPRGLGEAAWNGIKAYFRANAPSLLRSRR